MIVTEKPSMCDITYILYATEKYCTQYKKQFEWFDIFWRDLQWEILSEFQFKDVPTLHKLAQVRPKFDNLGLAPASVDAKNLGSALANLAQVLIRARTRPRF